MPSLENFDAVKDFCGQDEDLYWEIVIEIELSMDNLLETIKTKEQQIDNLKFIAHKMKSTFRILKDEEFKELLDGYVQNVEQSDKPAISSSAEKIIVQCEAYNEMLKQELSKRP